jgi:hypothetical protein
MIFFLEIFPWVSLGVSLELSAQINSNARQQEPKALSLV